MTDTTALTTGDVALKLGVKEWQVRRLFEDGKLPPAPRVGSYRVIDERDLPRVEAALRSAGYLR